MITTKQRSYLRGLAHDLEPVVYIGKQGMTDNILMELDRTLESRELIKVKLQEGCELDPKDIANQAAASLQAEYVQSIGRKFVLYRASLEHPQIQLPRPVRKR